MLQAIEEDVLKCHKLSPDVSYPLLKIKSRGLPRGRPNDILRMSLRRPCMVP